MKLGLSLNNINTILQNLKEVGFVVNDTFKEDLIESGYKIRDRAKQILEDESRNRTNKRYWTGDLHDSIQSNVTQREGNIIGISVGPDLRVAPHAEWIEIGHYMGYGKEWWEGYHYMSQAYAQLSDEIPREITKTLSVKLNKFKQGSRTRHARTGRFVRGFTVQG